MQEILAGYGAAILYSIVARNVYNIEPSDPKNWMPAVGMISLGVWWAFKK